MSDPEETIDRRKFLTKSAALLAGGAALARTAPSYDKILGANDSCLSLCQHIALRLFKEVRRGRGCGFHRVWDGLLRCRIHKLCNRSPYQVLTP